MAKSKGPVEGTPSEAPGEALNARQQKFLDAYLVDPNATKAAIAAGYSAKTAYSIGQRLLKNVEIQAALNFERAEASKRARLTNDQLLDMLDRLADFDPRQLFNEDGSAKAITELDDATALAVASFETAQVGDEGVVTVRKIKVADRLQAIRLSMQQRGMLTDKVEHSGQVSVPGLTIKKTYKA